MIHRALFFAALVASSPAVAGSDLPNRAELLAALNALETCGGPAGPECGPTSREYRVHRAHCMKIAPEDGRAAAACRIDLSLLYRDPDRNTRHHDSCVRFARRGGGGGDAPGWVVLQVRDRPCEMGSRLKRDPNPEPDPAQMEKALIGMLTCYDTDGITDCVAQPTKARVDTMRCKSIASGPEGRVRVACRVTASVAFPTHFRSRRFTDECVRLDRLTEKDESPASWIAIYVPQEVRCEVH